MAARVAKARVEDAQRLNRGDEETLYERVLKAESHRLLLRPLKVQRCGSHSIA